MRQFCSRLRIASATYIGLPKPYKPVIDAKINRKALLRKQQKVMVMVRLGVSLQTKIQHSLTEDLALQKIIHDDI